MRKCLKHAYWIDIILLFWIAANGRKYLQVSKSRQTFFSPTVHNEKQKSHTFLWENDSLKSTISEVKMSKRLTWFINFQEKSSKIVTINEVLTWQEGWHCAMRWPKLPGTCFQKIRTTSKGLRNKWFTRVNMNLKVNTYDIVKALL